MNARRTVLGGDVSSASAARTPSAHASCASSVPSPAYASRRSSSIRSWSRGSSTGNA